ncbi:hypothetical protein ACYSNW_12850 [Enterococcus sp. LJL99]
MRTIHYAIASNTYHRKKTILISIIFFVFLSLLTGILNLIDIEKILFKQYTDLMNTNQADHFQKNLFIYYFSILILYLLIISIFSYFFLKSKQDDIIKWKLMGFSKGYIIKQILAELFIPTFFVSFFVLIFVLIFQHTYDYMLLQCHQGISKSLGFLKTLTLHSTNGSGTTVTKEMTPLATNSIEHVRFLDLGVTRLPSQYVVAAFFKTYALLLFFLSIVTTIGSSLFILKSRNKLRK